MVFRERRRSRHRAVESRPADSASDDELESYLAAISPTANGVSSELTGRFGSAQVFQLRLPGLRIEQLRRLAEARGTPPTTLVVEWVLQRLALEDPDRHRLHAADATEPVRADAPTVRIASVTRLPLPPAHAPLLSSEAIMPSRGLTPVTAVTSLAARTRPPRSDAHPAGARHRAPSR